MQQKPWFNVFARRQQAPIQKPQRDWMTFTFDKDGEFIDLDSEQVLEVERQVEHNFREEFLKTVNHDD